MQVSDRITEVFDLIDDRCFDQADEACLELLSMSLTPSDRQIVEGLHIQVIEATDPNFRDWLYDDSWEC